MADIIGQDYPDNLNRFARAVWGSDQALIKRLPFHNVEFIDLGEHFKPLQSLFAGILQHPKILVRDEYRIALSELQTGRYQNGAYVIGQPGIGKTYFLVYVLVQCLAQRRPVALQLLNGKPFYAFFKDTVVLYSLDFARPLLECPSDLLPVWALCDSNGDTESPDGTFKSDPERIWILQTTPPKASRWKEWSKQIGAVRYVMDIWSEEEIADLAVLLELDVERMTTLAKKWGAIPRTLLQCLLTDEWEIEVRYRQISREAVKECETMMDALARLDLPRDGPSAFYFLRPMRDNKGIIHRALSYVCVPTKTLRYLLAEALQEMDNSVKLRFFNALSYFKHTRQVPDFIYKSWFHSYVSSGFRIRCQWVDWDGDRPPIELRGTTNLVPMTKDAPSSGTPPFYWVPPHLYLPGIDSALVLENEIFAIQVNIASEHWSPVKGLHRLRKSLPDNLKDLPYRVVFVGMEEGSVRQVAEQWADLLSFPKGTPIPVAWSSVDPMQRGVAYRVFHDESDPVSLDEELMEVEQ